MRQLSATKLVVYGKVQGVFYRKSTQEKAKQLGLRGWVENSADGTVHVFAQGLPNALNELIRWCKVGPAQAKVERVAVFEAEVQDITSFSIKA